MVTAKFDGKFFLKKPSCYFPAKQGLFCKINELNWKKGLQSNWKGKGVFNLRGLVVRRMRRSGN